MKATGIVRRIDDLGRIVIPIEIRRSMNIRDGDPLEIFVEKDGEVILKKYSALADLDRLAQAVMEAVHSTTGFLSLLTDRDQVVAVAGEEGQRFLGKEVGVPVLNAMEERREARFRTTAHHHEGATVGGGDTCPFASEVIAPVVVAGDPVGAVIVASLENGRDVGEGEAKVAAATAGFLARHLAG
ncbi:MAG: AbrB/MazE/SpoVT family DNA-binding domain-containing protein [Clostridia bacterium]|nr:AbrB/MazE/SpoVT family DNA-binding domain-containing protein [Clostridia bacterium]MCL6521796.1 AbrB/MazE/SpoVT family DNA-binding domain-containing protein [Bacillota bacterium]